MQACAGEGDREDGLMSFKEASNRLARTYDGIEAFMWLRFGPSLGRCDENGVPNKEAKNKWNEIVRWRKNDMFKPNNACWARPTDTGVWFSCRPEHAENKWWKESRDHQSHPHKYGLPNVKYDGTNEPTLPYWPAWSREFNTGSSLSGGNNMSGGNLSKGWATGMTDGRLRDPSRWLDIRDETTGKQEGTHHWDLEYYPNAELIKLSLIHI